MVAISNVALLVQKAKSLQAKWRNVYLSGSTAYLDTIAKEKL